MNRFSTPIIIRQFEGSYLSEKPKYSPACMGECLDTFHLADSSDLFKNFRKNHTAGGSLQSPQFLPPGTGVVEEKEAVQIAAPFVTRMELAQQSPLTTKSTR